jgi:hypothetical protein
MTAKTPKPPTPIDPTTVINAQSAANRIDKITPFGSQTYGTGPNGQQTFTTSLSPGMQGLVDRSMQVAQTPLTPLSQAPGLGNLQNLIMNKVTQQQMPSQKPSPQGMQPPNNSLMGQPVNPAWNQALNKVWGGQ